MKSGIYKIQSKCKPDRIYIGSAINIEGRKRAHFSRLKHGYHHSIKLQRHYDKYGYEEACRRNARGDKAAGGRGNKGKPKSEEHKASISQSISNKYK